MTKKNEAGLTISQLTSLTAIISKSTILLILKAHTRDMREHSGVLEMFYTLIKVVITQVYIHINTTHDFDQNIYQRISNLNKKVSKKKKNICYIYPASLSVLQKMVLQNTSLNPSIYLIPKSRFKHLSSLSILYSLFLRIQSAISNHIPQSSKKRKAG